MEQPQLQEEDKSLGRNLALATKLRLILDEIASRISTRKKDEDVVKALMQLSGVVEEDTITGALRLYERGRVKLFGLKQKASEERAPLALRTTADDQAELDRLIEEMHEKEKERLEQRRLPEAKITLPTRVCHGRRGMLVAQVGSSPVDRFVYPEANYCGCEQFERRVLEKRTSFTCVHWLAAWLALAMGHKIEETSAESLLLMRRAIVGVEKPADNDEPVGDRS